MVLYTFNPSTQKTRGRQLSVSVKLLKTTQGDYQKKERGMEEKRKGERKRRERGRNKQTAKNYTN